MTSALQARCAIVAFLVAGLGMTGAAQTDRAAFFDRHLAPGPGPEVTRPATNDRNEQRQFEAAEFYARGLVFAQQGAWRDAETAFRDAERRNDREPIYRYGAAFAYLKTHKTQEAYKRYEAAYKANPSDTRALLGMIAAREDIQHYRDAVDLWQRYVRMPLPDAERAEVETLLQGARDLFAERYEIAENPTGGAANLATPQQELEWGLGYAKELSSSGVPLLDDEAVVEYVRQMSQQLVDHAKQFPTNYQLYVLDTMGVNATTVPGFIFVYRGLLEAAPSEAALAGVLAHEIGHSVAHHTAKKVTRSFQDQQQLERLRASDSKLSKFLAGLLEAGNPVGAMTFSREAEAQADRLGVHIAFDAGFDPLGLTEMFQIFEQLSPSSRNSWDLMSRTHPFSIDRINAVREYAALLPDRPVRQTSDTFAAMKARLAALPAAPDATGRLITAESTPAPTESTRAEAPEAPRPEITAVDYSLAPVPFHGRMPAGWTYKQDKQTVTFSAPAGTPEAEALVWLRLAPLASQPGWTIDDFLEAIQDSNAKLDGIEFAEPDHQQTPDGRQIRVMPFAFNSRTSTGVATQKRGVFIFAEFPDYIVIGQYAAPTPYFSRLSGPFDLIWNSLSYGGAATAAPGRLPFTIERPAFAGEMPNGWVSRQTEEGAFIIEGRPGTEAYEMTIRIAFSPKQATSLAALADELERSLKGLPQSVTERADITTTKEGRPARLLVADYVGKDSQGQSGPFRQAVAVIEYVEYYVMLGYSGPAALIDKYADAYEVVGTSLRERRDDKR